MIPVKIVGVKEEKDPAARLVPDPAFLIEGGSLCQEQRRHRV